MSSKSNMSIAMMGIDIGNSFHVVGLDQSGAIVLRPKWSRGQIETRLANMSTCLIGMEACVGASPEPQAALAWSRRSPDAGEIRASLSGRHKYDFRDEKAIAENGTPPDDEIRTAVRLPPPCQSDLRDLAVGGV